MDPHELDLRLLALEEEVRAARRDIERLREELRAIQHELPREAA